MLTPGPTGTGKRYKDAGTKDKECENMTRTLKLMLRDDLENKKISEKIKTRTWNTIHTTRLKTVQQDR
jgi:hypothetical protein